MADRPAGRHAAPRAARRERSSLLVRLGAGFLVCLVLSVLGLFPVQLVRVSSGSMAPSIDAGDLALVLRWPVSVERWDVVVADPLQPGTAPLVKRVVALGGESVAVEDGVLVVDGTAVCEPWSDPARLDGVWFGPVRVPDGSVFLLGDEREGSVDSRVFGPVDESRLRGVVLATAWPSPRTVPGTPC
ncbi:MULTISPECIES: signal peptidase I [unclassified Blastococcus]|uniref:signal peptidase I n=1 Tax=unclassified Blastococcus TaxID=2619396 RepID=UPI001EEF86DC|nr:MULTISPECIES: signal peptidase I [unclassified Blastococcus]